MKHLEFREQICIGKTSPACLLFQPFYSIRMIPASLLLLCFFPRQINPFQAKTTHYLFFQELSLGPQGPSTTLGNHDDGGNGFALHQDSSHS